MDSLREKEGTKANKTFLNGIGLPLFVRARYSFPKNFFIQADAGYQLGALSFDLVDFYFYPTCRSITGFFAEPQAGFSFNPGKTISFGLSLQGHPFLHSKEYTDSSGIFTHTGGTDHTFDAVAFIRFCIEL
jgi:hypothetical protein